MTPQEVKEIVPIIDISKDARYPILGASYQRRGGTARHDAVAWGFARAADARGVDVIQQCEVTGFRQENGRVVGVDTTQGYIGAKKVAVVTAGNSGVLAEMAGFRLPIESHPLQAWVTEPIKPVLHSVVMSNAVHAYISQTDRGELLAEQASTRTPAMGSAAASASRSTPSPRWWSCSRSSAGSG